MYPLPAFLFVGLSPSIYLSPHVCLSLLVSVHIGFLCFWVYRYVFLSLSLQTSRCLCRLCFPRCLCLRRLFALYMFIDVSVSMLMPVLCTYSPLDVVLSFVRSPLVSLFVSISLSVPLYRCICLSACLSLVDSEDDDDSFDQDEAALRKEISDLPKNVGVRKVSHCSGSVTEQWGTLNGAG